MTQFDFGKLRRALETRDADLLISLYADAAEIRVVNQHTPPSRPFQVRGKAEIETHLLDLCGRDMSHEVSLEVLSPQRISYAETCRYPDGTTVLASNILEVADGKITGQVSVETWDE